MGRGRGISRGAEFRMLSALEGVSGGQIPRKQALRNTLIAPVQHDTYFPRPQTNHNIAAYFSQIFIAIINNGIV